MIVVEWKFTMFLHQVPWLDATPHTRGVARLCEERQATPRVRGGASNHGSWRKYVVNSYIITTMVKIYNLCYDRDC